MKIAGIEKLSFVDYPGMLSAVFFTPGCNMNCYYCHNRSLIAPEPAATWFGEKVAMACLDERAGFLDAVAITGGEPTLQADLPDFIRRVREKGYLVKLDTNGTNPSMLAELLREELIDYVAMDVKAPPHRYERVSGVQTDLAAIDASISLILASSAAHEFRTTAAPQLDAEDIVAIAHWIQGANRYVLQQYRRPAQYEGFSDIRNAVRAHPPDWPVLIIPRIRSLVKHCQVRGFEIRERTSLTVQ